METDTNMFNGNEFQMMSMKNTLHKSYHRFYLYSTFYFIDYFKNSFKPISHLSVTRVLKFTIFEYRLYHKNVFRTNLIKNKKPFFYF